MSARLRLSFIGSRDISTGSIVMNWPRSKMPGIWTGLRGVWTDASDYLKIKWLRYGLALSVRICLPNLMRQDRNHFISLDFLQHIHPRDMRIGRTENFLPEQLQFSLFGFVLFIAG